MRSLGKFYIGNNQAGKGDALRPKAKIFNDKLFMSEKQKREWNKAHNFKTHCQVCGERIYQSKTFTNKEGKTLTVGNCCKDKIYV